MIGHRLLTDPRCDTEAWDVDSPTVFQGV